ncbi:MAG: SDR family oxidoreductase [Hyphomonadaceae bacterium]
MKQVLVVGATGDVGHGAVAALLDAGYGVIGASRGGEKARALAARYGGRPFQLVQGSLADEAAGAQLAQTVRACAGGPVAAVIASINHTPERPETLLDWKADALLATINDNLISHFIAAKTLTPLVADGGVYIGVGGGMADKIFPYYGYNSMIQAALWMMYRYVDREQKDRRIEIRELIIAAMVRTEAKPDVGEARFNWILDREVGEHLTAMVREPAAFPGPVQLINSAKGVGRSLVMDLPRQPSPNDVAQA